MEYNGRDNVSDILRGYSGALEESSAPSTSAPLAGAYYALPLFGRADGAYVRLSVMHSDACGICVWNPLFLRGHCFCQMDRYCAGDFTFE